jgi:hypothetical protein
MIDERERYERAFRQFQMPEPAWGRLIGRRDRKRRNQRIAAGVVGIAVFVAAIWIVTSGSLDRSETSVVPGGDVTGPAGTGPTVHEAESDDIPPAGTAVSTPVEGELIAESDFYPSPYVRVYADGRVLSTRTPGGGGLYVERRLSREGVELVRSGTVQPGDLLGSRHLVSESAWEDRDGKPYVPARYSVCWRSGGPLEPVLDLLPRSAQALLRAGDPALNPQCLEVTPEEARSLKEILSEAGSPHGNALHTVGAWLLRNGKGDQVGITLHPLFPDGRRVFRIPF